MNRVLKRLTTAILAAAMVLGSMTAASAQTVTVTPAKERLYIAAGCPGTGTCTSTRWLGKQPGDATSNFVTSVTPVDEVQYRATGFLNWRDYPGNTSLRAAGYKLRSAENMVATVGLSTTGIAANMSVHVRVETVMADNSVKTFGPQEQVVTMLPNSTTTVPFNFDIPDALEGAVVKTGTVYIAVHGVNVQGGYINQAGASTLDIPYWIETVTP